MLTNSHFVEHSESQHILNVAPGEGSIPLSIFRDQYSEELAYPGIFLGQKRIEDKDRLVSVHYSDICKSDGLIEELLCMLRTYSSKQRNFK